MEAKELMIGDLVRVSKDVCFKKGTIVKIHGIDADHVFPEKGLKGVASCMPVNDPDRVTSGVWCDYLEPIPLTEEMLKANGYEEHVGEKGAYGVTIAPHFKRDDSPEVFCDGHPFAVWFDEPVDIKYVHQLQHILRLCGAEKEIELKQ